VSESNIEDGGLEGWHQIDEHEYPLINLKKSQTTVIGFTI
jgi:hypothetical protein